MGGSRTCHFRARPQEHDLGGAVVKQSMQSAVYKALDGQPDHFIVDPHFHTVEHNFLIFKTAKTQVVGRRQQIKITDKLKDLIQMIQNNTVVGRFSANLHGRKKWSGSHEDYNIW
jgi:hypothetical protein